MSGGGIDEIMRIVMAEYFNAFGQGTGVKKCSRPALQYLWDRVYEPTKSVIEKEGLTAWLTDRQWVLALMVQVGQVATSKSRNDVWIREAHARQAFEDVACDSFQPEEEEARAETTLGRYCNR